jgi:hypothetical protein
MQVGHLFSGLIGLIFVIRQTTKNQGNQAIQNIAHFRTAKIIYILNQLFFEAIW